MDFLISWREDLLESMYFLSSQDILFRESFLKMQSKMSSQWLIFIQEESKEFTQLLFFPCYSPLLWSLKCIKKMKWKKNCPQWLLHLYFQRISSFYFISKTILIVTKQRILSFIYGLWELNNNSTSFGHALFYYLSTNSDLLWLIF